MDEQPKCDFKDCKEKAEYSIEAMWHRYHIENNGDYEKEAEWSGEDTNRYCKKHAEIEGIL